MFDLKGYGFFLLEGVQLTVAVGVLSLSVACVLGLVGAWGKLSSSKVAKRAAGTYTTVVRGIPELILILLVYYGVPTLIQDIASGMGKDIIVDFNPFRAGVLTLGFIYGAFATEVFRGAFLAVPRGQVEAAKAVGMSTVTRFRRIIMPQMWRFALPGLGNVWMVLLKATALISIIQLDELVRKAQIAAGATHLPFTFYFWASIIFLCITIVSMVGQHYVEQWANRGVRRA